MSNKIVNVTVIAQNALNNLNVETCDIFEVEAACQNACSAAGYDNVEYVADLVLEMIDAKCEELGIEG